MCEGHRISHNWWIVLLFFLINCLSVQFGFAYKYAVLTVELI